MCCKSSVKSDAGCDSRQQKSFTTGQAPCRINAIQVNSLSLLVLSASAEDASNDMCTPSVRALRYIATQDTVSHI